jgi:hypothetical protein
MQEKVISANFFRIKELFRQVVMKFFKTLMRFVPKMNPKKRNKTPKYCVTVPSHVPVNEEQLLDAACEGTTLHRDEAWMMFDCLFKEAEEYLNLGFNVYLGEWGESEKPDE